jgi:hypothetical protein
MRSFKFTAFITLLFASLTLCKFIAFADDKAVKNLKLPIYNRSDADTQTGANGFDSPVIYRREDQYGAASGLRVPRLFALPTIVFKTISSVPGALAVALPSPSRYADSSDPDVAEKGEALDKRCFNCFGLTCVPCPPGQNNAGIGLRAPRVFALPALFLNAVWSIPRTLAAALPDTAALEFVEKDTEEEVLEKRCFNCFGLTCVPCKPGQNNAAGGLRVPRVFVLPSLLFNAAASIPRALASAIPDTSAFNIFERASEREDLAKRCFNCFGMTCVPCPPGQNNAAGALRIPQIFTLPTILFKALASVPRTLASAIPDTSALGLEDEILEKRCFNCFGNTCVPCPPGQNNAAGTLRIPRVFALPTLFINIVTSIPRALAAALPALPVANVQQNAHHSSVVTSDDCWTCKNGRCAPCQLGHNKVASVPEIPTPNVDLLPIIPRALYSAIGSPGALLNSVEKRDSAAIEEPQCRNCWFMTCKPCPPRQKGTLFSVTKVPSSTSSKGEGVATSEKNNSSFLDRRHLEREGSFLDSRTGEGEDEQASGGLHDLISGRGVKSLEDLSKRYNSFPKPEERFWGSSTSLRAPQIFSRPTLILTTLSQAFSALALAIPRPHQIINPLAMPSFDSVRKAVSDLRGMMLVKRKAVGEKRYDSSICSNGRFGQPVCKGTKNGIEGWEDRIGSVWIGMFSAAIMFARSL